MWGRVCHNGVGRHTFGDNTLIISNGIATTLTDRGVGTPNLMQRKHHTPGGSDIRYPIVSHSDFNNQWFTPYTNAAEINPHQIKHTSSSSWIQDHNRPHLNVILDKKHEVKALVDSGSSICLADASVLSHINNKSPTGPKIHVTDCHNNQKITRGCYQANIDIEEDIPYPVRNKKVNIHIAERLSSELILGTDFLRENGAIINVRDNKVIFLPNRMAAIGACKKPIITEAVASLTSTNIPYEDLTKLNSSAYMLQSTTDQTLGHMDQITFKAQIITEPTLQLKPGTTVLPLQVSHRLHTSPRGCTT
jgi:hypothetical protein